MPQHSAILRSPPHARPWRPRRQSGCLDKLMSVTDAVYLQCLGQGLEAATDQGWHIVRGSTSNKTWFLKCSQTIDIQVRNVESLWFKTWKNNPEIHGFIQHLHTVYDIQLDWEYLTTQLDPRWTIKLQHLQHGQTSHCQRISKTWHHDMPQHSAILRSPSHTPGLGALGTNVVGNQADACDGRVYLQRLGQGLEAATDQGWRLVRGPFGQTLISEMLKQKDIQLRHVESLWFKTWKNNPEIHGFIQHLHTVWHTAGLGVFGNSTRSEMNDETTAPANHPNFSLSEDFENIEIMTCRSIQRFCRAHHTPGLGALVANLVVGQIDVCDWRVYLQCLG